MQPLMSDLGISKIHAHMCRFGMMSEDVDGKGFVKKPTRLITNSEHMGEQLSRKCMGGHRHAQLDGGRARVCQVYPDKLVRAILKGIRMELAHDGVMSLVYNDLLQMGQEEIDTNDYNGQIIDDMSGQLLNKELVVQARNKEMMTYFAHKAYDKVQTSEKPFRRDVRCKATPGAEEKVVFDFSDRVRQSSSSQLQENPEIAFR